MAFQPVPDTIQVFTEFRMPSGALVGNVYHVVDLQAGITGVRVGACLDIFRTQLSSSNFTGIRSNETTFVRLNGRDLTVEFGTVDDRTINPPVAGTVSSPAMPAQVTIALSLRTGLAGRSARGRLYHCGLAEVMVGNDFVAAGYQNGLLTAYQTLRSMLLASDFQWAVVQRVSNGVRLPEGVTRGITSIIAVDWRVDTQRRRLVGEGN